VTAPAESLRFPIGRFAMPAAFTVEAAVAHVATIRELPARLRAAVAGLTEAQLDTPYREGGWTVRQVVHHLADSHLHAYLRSKFAYTEDVPTIMPYEEAVWATLPDTALPVDGSLAILDGLHRRWTALLDALDDETWQRAYYHPESAMQWPLWKVAALYAWHSRHHVAHITTLREREGW
jgi:hypothetical protein